MKYSLVTSLISLSLAANALASNPNDDKGKGEWVPDASSAVPTSSHTYNDIIDDFVIVGEGGFSADPFQDEDDELTRAMAISLEEQDDELEQAMALSMQTSAGKAVHGMIEVPKTTSLSKLNAIDLYPSADLKELSDVVYVAETCNIALNTPEMPEHLKEQSRKLLRQCVDALRETSFAKAALEGVLPSDESDVNYHSRIGLCCKVSEILTAAKQMQFEPTNILLKEEQLATLPEIYIPFAGGTPAVRLLTPGAPLRPRDDFQDESAYLRSLLTAIEKLPALPRVEEIKEMLFPCLIDREMFQQKLMEIQMKYLNIRNMTTPELQKGFKGFEQCKELIRQINSRFPGLFQPISKAV